MDNQIEIVQSYIIKTKDKEPLHCVLKAELKKCLLREDWCKACTYMYTVNQFALVWCHLDYNIAAVLLPGFIRWIF